MLALEPTELGGLPDGGRVFGVILDLARPDGTASLVTLVDGTVNLLFVEGGGDVGAGRHPDVRAVADRLLAAAEACAPEVPFGAGLPLPAAGRAALHLLTRDGTRSLEAEEPALAANPRLAPVMRLGLELVERIRAAVGTAEAV